MYPVIKAASYILVHTPNIMIEGGTTQQLERDSQSDYMDQALKHIRSFQEAVLYAPNQAYIGNITPEVLENIPRPWYKNPLDNSSRYSKHGEIMPEDEFYILMQICDSFDLVKLDKDFVENMASKISQHPVLRDYADKIKPGINKGEIEAFIGNGAVPLRINGNLVGCVRKAHDKDINLSSHVMLENIATKASAVLALRHLVQDNNIDADSIEYVIECSEEACGDMNQRGGGNFAKAVAEIAGFSNATGSDTRAFCAGPTHALINASALVKAGIYKNVAIVGGGAVAKLGMNGRDHVKNDMPLLEDVLGGFAILVSENDGINPIVNTDIIGRHTVKTGSSPQQVIQSIVADPLDRAGMSLTDIDKYSVEMQNPEITEPAGAGDVPKSNYKMIAALAVKKGQLTRAEMDGFIDAHGLPGFAPTQGHIPSGVPYVGPAREAILSGEIKNAMIIGKGSLFLGRMTNQFDGVSVVLSKNPGIAEESPINEDKIRKIIASALRDLASHLGED
ncbi:MAG: glycine/sarcosine/betaine reductase complex component C subunit beta [Thermoanaerobacteraceae bacterium]|nr:glycine/sarcosine/betaine reductase complex component C subunit beta [Thermoanaerobacteraceae bacterium]